MYLGRVFVEIKERIQNYQHEIKRYSLLLFQYTFVNIPKSIYFIKPNKQVTLNFSDDLILYSLYLLLRV
jgi:hypothetical protein